MAINQPRPALWGHPAVKKLLAEVERLRAENTVLKARIQQLAEAAERDHAGQRQDHQDQDDQ